MRWTEERVDTVLNELAELLFDGNGSNVQLLRPQDLVYLGGKFRSLYQLGLVPSARSTALKEIFPNGWDSFIERLTAVAGSENSVCSIKKDVPEYSLLQIEEREFLQQLSETYVDGTVELNEVTDILDDVGIELTPYRKNKFFPEQTCTATCSNDSLDELMRDLEGERKKSGQDLSNIDCVKGELFESLVGIVLVDLFGRQNVDYQVRKTIDYQGFDGRKHREVFLDYDLPQDIVEVKWENDIENILESILPQHQATKPQNKNAIVICRNKCYDLAAWFDEGFSMDHICSELHLEPIGNPSEAILYRTFDELIEGMQHQELYKRALETIEHCVLQGNITKLRNYEKIFRRIHRNGQDTTDKLELAVDCMRSGDMLNSEEIRELFGAEHLSISEANAAVRRRKIESLSANSMKEKRLIDIYNTLFGTTCSKLTENMREQIQVQGSDMIKQAYDLLIERKKVKKEKRAEARHAKKPESLDVELRAYRDTYSNLYHERMGAITDVLNQFIPLTIKLLELCDIPNGRKEKTPPIRDFDNRWVQDTLNLLREKGYYFGNQNEFLKELKEFTGKIKDIDAVLFDDYKKTFSGLKNNRKVEEEEKTAHRLESLRVVMREYEKKAESNAAISGVYKLFEELKQRKIRASASKRANLANLARQISILPEIAGADALDMFTSLPNVLADIHPALSAAFYVNMASILNYSTKYFENEQNIASALYDFTMSTPIRFSNSTHARLEFSQYMFQRRSSLTEYLRVELEPIIIAREMLMNMKEYRPTIPGIYEYFIFLTNSLDTFASGFEPAERQAATVLQLDTMITHFDLFSPLTFNPAIQLQKAVGKKTEAIKQVDDVSQFITDNEQQIVQIFNDNDLLKLRFTDLYCAGKMVNARMLAHKNYQAAIHYLGTNSLNPDVLEQEINQPDKFLEYITDVAQKENQNFRILFEQFR